MLKAHELAQLLWNGPDDLVWIDLWPKSSVTRGLTVITGVKDAVPGKHVELGWGIHWPDPRPPDGQG